MIPKVDFLDTFIKTAAVSGIGLTSQLRLSKWPGISFQLRQKKKLIKPFQNVKNAMNFSLMTEMKMKSKFVGLASAIKKK